MTISSAHPDQVGDLPSIVLLIDRHRDTLERYSRCLEAAGLWVAVTTVADEAIAAAEEIRPDIVVADADTGAADGTALTDAFKDQPGLRHIPFIVMAERRELCSRADCVLIKPVEDAVLLARARDLLVRAREARARARDAISRGASLLARSSLLLEKASGLEAAARRRCPDCGGPLDWVERGVIGSATYDYYRWCLKGCGLFCFDVSKQTWVRLA